MTILVDAHPSSGVVGIGVIKSMLPRTDQWAYRIPYALQWMWPVPLLIGVALAPESPWWLAHDDVGEDYAGATYWDCFKGTDLRRTEIVCADNLPCSCMVWATQNLAGNSFTGYSTYFLEQAGLAPAKSYDFALGLYALIILVSAPSYLPARGRHRSRLRSSTSLSCFPLMLFLLPLDAHPIAFAQARINVVEAPSRYPEANAANTILAPRFVRRFRFPRQSHPLLLISSRSESPTDPDLAPYRRCFASQKNTPRPSPMPGSSREMRPLTVHALSIPARTVLLLYALKADTRPALAMGFKSRVNLRALQILAPFKSTGSCSSPCVQPQLHQVRASTSSSEGRQCSKFASTRVDVFDDVHGASAGKGGNGVGEGSMDGEEGEKAGRGGLSRGWMNILSFKGRS
ncbi:hypothetical protein C8R44DRAFT_915998 [Mycena epipterygia]|nr:hypothetical protein C8R44DRAFT_915998 [Mycena epipterygia]